MKRINRFEQDRGFIAASGIKRIARGRDVSGEAQMAQTQGAAKPERTQRDAQHRLLVCCQAKAGELSTLDREVIYVARALAELKTDTAVSLALFGKLSDESVLGDAGIDELIVLADEGVDRYVPSAKVDCLLAEFERLNPDHVLFPEGPAGDSDLARRFAVRAGVSIATDVFEVSDKHVRRHSGNGRYQAQTQLPVVIGLQSGTTGDLDLEFVTSPNTQTQGSSLPDSVESLFSLPSGDIPLVEADFVISAGNGVRDMETFNRLAQALDATIGGSRVVVDDGKLPRERQVGATGQIVKAQVYLAIGISGAVQHLQGIKDCSTVIAVNSDPACDMVKRADLSVIADAQAWMESVLAKLEVSA